MIRLASTHLFHRDTSPPVLWLIIPDCHPYFSYFIHYNPNFTVQIWDTAQAKPYLDTYYL